MKPRWTHRPPGSNWGDFGPDDQKGRLNWLTPDAVLR
ncbi:cyclase family protein, partial [Paraburkholderia sp. Se-20369]|nr:cyclase family protein [Paraburkholderia sp. Se-20369]